MFSLTFEYRKLFLSLFFLIVVSAGIVSAQTNEFTYQGKLNDGTAAANGNYDLVFELHATPTGGAPIGARVRLNVPVTNGVFTVKLDFAAAAFNGADRFLEIGVKPAGSPGGYQQLLPRQPITYAPYSFRSLNATNADTATRAEDSLQLGGVAANQYVLTGDPRLSDARTPTGGSTFYIQNNPLLQQFANFNINGNGIVGGNLTVNGTLNANLPPGDGSYIQNRTSQQTGIVNFNIQGSGTVGGTLFATGAINTFAQYNIAGNRVLSAAGDNLFAGWSAGTNNTGTGNSFFGRNAGFANTDGYRNSFFGFEAGKANTLGEGNSFFGYRAGAKNNNAGGLYGLQNSFFGSEAGQNNTTGGFNAFFGQGAGDANTIGANNTFIGSQSGAQNTTGDFNTYIGDLAGRGNSTGSRNSYLGHGAGDSSLYPVSGSDNVFVGYRSGSTSFSGNSNTLIGSGANVGLNNLNFATAIGAGATVFNSNTIVLGRADGSDYVLVPGLLTIPNLAVAGTTNLCRNSFDRVGTCSSSLRYKTNVQTFFGGLDIVGRLRPITFNWRDGGMSDVGFAAEEVEQIEPLLATHNKDGQVEGVKYGQITTVLVNAVKEQQTQIEQQQTQIQKQQEQIQRQQQQIDALKKLVCSQNPNAEICKEKE